MNRPGIRLFSSAGTSVVQRQRVVGQDDHQRGLEQVVVEGAEELGPEERRETALRQQGKLARIGSCGKARLCEDA